MKFSNFNKPLILLAFITATSMNAIAFDTGKIKSEQTPFALQFEQLDINNNGLLNWSETAEDKTVNYESFINADNNGDESLSLNEYIEMKAELGKARVGQVASDSAITAKAKAKLLTEKNLNSIKISVETYEGSVILSGFVNNEEAKAKAEQIVSDIKGVKSVKNGLMIKS